jgi:hypothetical protein
MRNIKALVLSLIISLTIIACGPSLKVTSDSDSSVDFTKFKSFSLYGGSKNAHISPLNQDRIVNAIRNEMKGKGFVEDDTSPDLLVNAVAILKDKQEVTASTNYYGYGGAYRPYYWGAGMSTSSSTTYDVQQYKDGSIIIDIVEAANKKLVWQGTGNSRIDKPVDGSEAETKIAGAINKIMESFPPGKHK